MKFATRAIHVGQEADPATGATIVPIYQTSTYTQEAIGQHKGYAYAARATPHARPSKPAWPRSKTPGTAWPLLRAWRPPVPCSPC